MTKWSKFVVGLGIVGSIASIAGLLGQLHVVPPLPVLTSTVELPAWTIVAAVGVSMWLLPWAIGRALANASRYPSEQLEQASKRTRDLEIENQALKGELKTLQPSSQDLAKTLGRLHDVQQSLDAYESLEAEIMGLLRSGGEYDLLEIAQSTSAGGAGGRQRVLRAIAALGAKIEGLGGIHKKYRLAPNATAPADQRASFSGR